MKSKMILAVILAMVMMPQPAIASANPCPDYLLDIPGWCPQIKNANLPLPAGWSTTMPDPDPFSFRIQYVVVYNTQKWEESFPGITPPAGFPEEKWFIIARYYIPPVNPTRFGFDTYRYKITPFVFYDQRVFNAGSDAPNYVGGVYVGFTIKVTPDGWQAPKRGIVFWEVPPNTIPGIDEPIVPKASTLGFYFVK